MTMSGATGPEIESLQAEIDSWLDELLNGWEPQIKSGSMVIRDSVHGFIELDKYEAALLDSPPLQRLRFISQNGLARFVYPGMHHSRLEHSLGVLFVANVMMDSLSRSVRIDQLTRIHVRLAALVHDIGHVLFSHSGEEVIDRYFPGLFESIRDEDYGGEATFFKSDVGDDIAGGEILSYLIINSLTFQKLVVHPIFNQFLFVEEHPDFKIDWDDIGRLVIGKSPKTLPRWTTGVINGPFDADKLDYLMRDCRYSGIKAEVDTSRLIHSLRVVPDDFSEVVDWQGKLAIASSSLNYLEQILLAKLTLFVAVYHHHKIRALERMLLSIFDGLPEGEPDKQRLTKPRNIGDMLRLNEFDLWSRGLTNGDATGIVDSLFKRRLLKRCLVIDRTTVEKGSLTKLENLKSQLRIPHREREFIDEIFNGIHNPPENSRRHLYLDFPPRPEAHLEAGRALIHTNNENIEMMADMAVSLDNWIDSYAVNKTRGHLFFVSDKKAREGAAVAAVKAFKSRGIVFKKVAMAVLK